MKEDVKENQKEFSQLTDSKVLKEIYEYDKFGNIKTVKKLVENSGSKKAPKSNNLKSTKIAVKDSNGNKI
jgi:hypothetical protein